MKAYSKAPSGAIKRFDSLARGLAMALLLTSVGSHADMGKVTLNIQAQRTDVSLLQLAEEADVQIIFSPKIADGFQSPAVQGEMAINIALDKLLGNTNLTYAIGNDNVIEIRAKDEMSRPTIKEKSNFIEDIIVTAEKREQDMQDVPAAITAYTSEALDARGITTPQDLQFSVPGLSISEAHGGGFAKVYLRGVGNENTLIGGDPGVPIHVNGHYTQATQYILRDLHDVERVEIQRGPQGTLYGRNAVGGNINIITKKPSHEFEGAMGVDLGSYNKRQVQAVVSGPLTDRLRARVAISDDKRDGYVENLGPGGDDRESSDYTSVRLAVDYDVTDTLVASLNAYYFDDVGSNAARLPIPYPDSPLWSLYGAVNNPTATDPFKVLNDTASEQTDRSSGISLDISWDLGVVELRSQSAFDQTDRTSINDLDGSDVVRFEETWSSSQDIFTQEFQLLSTGTGPAKWVAGIFYYSEDSDLWFDTDVPSAISAADPRTIIAAPMDVSATSLAVYGQLDYAVTDRLETVIGLRYTKDKKDRRESIFFGIEDILPIFELPGTLNDGDDNWSEVTGKLGVNYHVNDDVFLYASWSRGYKSGGFSFTQSSPYNPETINAYEAGLKSRWYDNRLQANLVAFYYDYQNKQDLQRIEHPEFIISEIRNATAASVSGMELEAQAYITDNFLIDISLGYLQAEFDKYESFDVLYPSLGLQDFSGNKLPFSPEWKAHIGAQYSWELGQSMGELTARVDYSWVDDQYYNGFNRQEDGVVLLGNGDLWPSYHITNAVLQWESAETAWRAEAYVKNLTDEVVISNVFVNGGYYFAYYLPPRTYGVKVQYSF